MIAIFCGNAGGAWDNGKKYIEAGGVAGAGKGTPTHSAAVVGDTVGDPSRTRWGLPGYLYQDYVNCIVGGQSCLCPV